MLVKTRFTFLFLFAAVLLLHSHLWAQSGTTLLATTDLDCTWKLDGKPQGNLKADDSTVVSLSLGKHLVQATSADGLDKWKGVVVIKQVGQEMVEIKLKETRQRRVAEAEPSTPPSARPLVEQATPPATQATKDLTWTDSATGLMWAGKDNGKNVTWPEANSYCQKLSLAGFSNWRLPSIDELSGIYDLKENVNGWRIKGGIAISGWEWTSNTPSSSGEHRLFNFKDTRNSPVLVVYSRRCLCVRSAQ
jgi:hypothetical protein